jgi:hypothetical protein
VDASPAAKITKRCVKKAPPSPELAVLVVNTLTPVKVTAAVSPAAVPDALARGPTNTPPPRVRALFESTTDDDNWRVESSRSANPPPSPHSATLPETVDKFKVTRAEPHAKMQPPPAGEDSLLTTDAVLFSHLVPPSSVSLVPAAAVPVTLIAPPPP